jgi:hypothetical protein
MPPQLLQLRLIGTCQQCNAGKETQNRRTLSQPNNDDIEVKEHCFELGNNLWRKNDTAT